MSDQYEAYKRDLLDTLSGRKPLCVIEQRKSRAAFAEAWKYALRGLPGITFQSLQLADGYGVRQPALVIGSSQQILKFLKRMRAYERDIEKLRANFQFDMGILLGYDAADCYQYTQSELSRTCGCELCGGPTPESVRDNEDRGGAA